MKSVPRLRIPTLPVPTAVLAIAVLVLGLAALPVPTLAEEAKSASTEEHLGHVSKEDLQGIRRAALDYAESWYAGDREQIERALHPDLCKRIVRFDEERERSRVDHMSALTLIQVVGKGWGKQTPPEDRQKDVKILDVYGGAATVRLEMQGWIDFMHVGKVDGEWKIINVLWESKPRDG